MPKHTKLKGVLSVAALVAALSALGTPDAHALSAALADGRPEALQTFLRVHPTSPHAGTAFEFLRAGFKEPGDTGRPDIFGPPGPPLIGPPGQYG